MPRPARPAVMRAPLARSSGKSAVPSIEVVAVREDGGFSSGPSSTSTSDVAAFDLAPDWVCEVISPSTGRLDRTRKLPVYARELVGHLWIVDPISKTLERFVLAGGSWLLQGASGQDDLVRAEPFEAIEIDLSGFWID